MMAWTTAPAGVERMRRRRLRDGGLHDLRIWIIDVTWPTSWSLELGELGVDLASHAAAGPSCHQRDQGCAAVFSSAVRHRLGVIPAGSLVRMFCQVRPSTDRTEA